MSLIVLLLTALAAVFSVSTWTLAAEGPGSAFLRRRAPMPLLGLMWRLAAWFGGDEDGPAVPRPAPAPDPVPVDQYGRDAAGSRPEGPARRPQPLPPPPPPNGAAPPAEPAPGAPQSFGGPQSDLLHAITSVVRRASDGDIRDVRRCIKILATASDALGHGVSHLSRRLAEPDKHYGPEIWEPLSSASAQLRSGALHMGHSDANLISLLRSTVGELADSPRVAPHHSQLNGPV